MKNEIGLRLSLFRTSLEVVKRHNYDFESYSNALSLLNKPNFQDLGQRSLPSLDWEHYTILPDGKEKKAYGVAFVFFQTLEELAYTKFPNISKDEITKNVSKLVEDLNMVVRDINIWYLPYIEEIRGPVKYLTPPDSIQSK